MRKVRCKSEPTFRRRLFYASALFITLFLTDVYIVAQLAFKDLSHKVIDEALVNSLASLEFRVPETPDGIMEGPLLSPFPAEDCPPGDPQSPVSYNPCIPTQISSPQVTGIFRMQTVQRHRVVTDMRGRILWRGYMKASRLELGAPSTSPVFRPGHNEVREEWEVGGRRLPVVALRQPAEPGSNVIREIGIPQEQIDREIDALTGSLRMKVWIGAGVAVMVLLIAFFYVFRLLQRTRMLEAQAQMDDRLTFVGALAAGLAHEIRNPLNVLSMNLQMLEEEIAPRGNGVGDALVYTAALQGEISRLSSLVNNFLSYARPNQPRFESRDLNQVLEDLCLFVRPEFERRDLALRQDFTPYLPPVEMDEAQIRQALLNILMNATHILKAGGVVTVSSRVGPDGGAIVAIADDGPGIKEEDRERIFEVFYSSRGGGTGLGLPIAARIIESHGGTIAVESEPGRGACFIIKMPRRHAGPEGRRGPAAEVASTEGS